MYDSFGIVIKRVFPLATFSSSSPSSSSSSVNFISPFNGSITRNAACKGVTLIPSSNKTRLSV